MVEKQPFDNFSETYDSQFTNSVTGREQRRIVREYLEKRVSPGMDVLEMNCGTGEDAFFLAGLGCNVLATDASSGMINQCLKKTSTSQFYPFAVLE